MDIREILGKRRLFLDGGTGTSLQKLGLKAGERPETWNLLHPERIESLHRAYLDAGADIIYTNTFGANRLKYPEGGEFSLEEVVKSAVNIAKRAQIACGREDSSWVALDIGPSGKLLRPLGDLDFEDAVALFAEVVGYGAAAGADLVVIETMGDSYELKAAVLAAKENSELPIIATAAFDERARLLTGGTPESVTALLEGLRVDALGLNCGLGPREMLPIAERFAAAASL
ncbi:MAG TPA: homocysteine S-methyltransferase family protein, partial [Candidatus Scatomorpha pullistercoris]|nr:homocysteine S-methyltransferase family protein [Candidatus Scatomorpha pullistercoris]